MNSYVTYLLKALKNPVSLIVLGGLAMITLISGNLLPLLVGLAGEALFVIGAPALPAWRRYVDGRETALALDAAADKTREELAALPEEERQRYLRLEQTAKAIRENYARYSDASRDVLARAEERLDDMLTRYLRMLIAKQSYAKHLTTNTAQQLEARISGLEEEMQRDDERLREVKTRQLAILGQRREKLRKAESDSALLDAQLGTLEEMIMLIKEQAITMKDPEEMTAQLDALMDEVAHTEDTVTSIETSFELAFDRELEQALKQ